jgi:hypothetical protein
VHANLESARWVAGASASLTVQVHERPEPAWVAADDRNHQRAHILGADNVDGSDTLVVAFFENLGVNSPFWFRLWVDADGLVHRAEMRGQGHFMDEHYTDFDAPFTIQPPT